MHDYWCLHTGGGASHNLQGAIGYTSTPLRKPLPFPVLSSARSTMDVALQVLAFIPPGIVAWSVAKQSKTFAALAQMGSMQARLHSPLSPQKPKGGLHEAIANTIRLRDKLIYMLGVLNIAVSCYLLGALPGHYYLWHSPKVAPPRPGELRCHVLCMRWISIGLPNIAAYAYQDVYVWSAL